MILQPYHSAKQAIASSRHSLAYFHPVLTVPTAASCDASPFGLGAILWRQDKNSCWLAITCASRTLTEGERRYSQLEGEMGVVFALTRFRQHVLGRHVEVCTDRKPLLPIIQKPFDDVPPRLQLVSLMPYDYNLKHLPGKQLSCADALARAPVSDCTSSPAESRSLHVFVSLVIEQLT